MTLNVYAAERRRAVFDALRAGQDPPFGSFDADALREARMKGVPQVGATRYEPNAVHFEFIFPDPSSTSAIVTVTIEPPERIVFLPVPEWVIENIWQGDIDGSYQFESQAQMHLAALAKELEPESNLKWFGPRQPKRRE